MKIRTSMPFILIFDKAVDCPTCKQNPSALLDAYSGISYEADRETDYDTFYGHVTRHDQDKTLSRYYNTYDADTSKRAEAKELLDKGFELYYGQLDYNDEMLPAIIDMIPGRKLFDKRG